MIGGMIKAYKGKKYGNRIADWLGIHRGLFHSAMEEGGLPMHMIWLYFLEKENLKLEDAAELTTETLTRGLLQIETRFGRQTLIDDALLRIKELEKGAHEGPVEQSQSDEERVASSVFSEGRYELSYYVEIAQKLRGKEYIIKEPYVSRSNDLDSLKSMALMKQLGGVSVTLKDLKTGKELQTTEM